MAACSAPTMAKPPRRCILTSGYVYDDAEQAEATFAGTVEHYQYSRFANPTLTMLEERLCLIEGAEACRTTATGMAAVNAALLSHLKAGDRVVASRALFGSCHWIVSTLLPKFGIETEFVDGADLGAVARGAVAPDQPRAAGDAVQPDAGTGRPAGGRRTGACGRRDRRGGQRVRHAAVAAAAEAGRRCRGLFLHQAHRRAGPRAGRRGAGQQEMDQRRAAAVHPQHRPGAVAVQRLGAAEGPGDAGAAGRCGWPRRLPRSPISWPSSPA